MAGFPGFPFSNNPSSSFGFSSSSSSATRSSSNPFHFSATKQPNDDATIKSIVKAVEKLEKTEGFPPEILQQIKNELKKIYPHISFNAKHNNASNSQGSESSTSSTTTSSSNNINNYSFPSNNNYNNLFINSQQEFYNNYLLSFQQHSMNDQLQFAQVQAQMVQAQVAQAQAQVQAQVAQAQAQAQVAQAQVQAQVAQAQAQAQAQVQMLQQSYLNTLGNIGTTPGIISPNYFANTYPSYVSDNGPQYGGAGATSSVANAVKMMLEMMGNSGNINGLASTVFGGIGGAATGFGSEGFSALSFLGGILGGFGL